MYFENKRREKQDQSPFFFYVNRYLFALIKDFDGVKTAAEPPTIEKCNELSKQLFYTRLASIPGRTESFWKELDYVKNLWKNRKELKVEDAGIAALFGMECFAWFCAGEIVGRGFTFTGYYV
ncbi:hypothetical protein V6N11_081586 [Hibiscus sabdariffa]|uniref:Mitochondrial ATP synthase subunit G protein n=1 Tax=Hibiscus sabdariffa TaxID=183260 RepID=A0ABR1ZTJ1_9ROSI